MKHTLYRLAGLAGAALLWAGATALPAAADDLSVHYEAVPAETQIATGDTLVLSVRCTEAALDPAACSLTFSIGDGYVFSSAAAGTGISEGELSYSYQNGQLILLYLDNAGGNSPLAPGGEMATITLQAADPGEGAPVTCTVVDSSAVDAGGNVVTQTGDLDVGTVSVSGETVALPTAAPALVEDGTATDLTEVVPSAAPDAGSTAGTDEAPAPTPYMTTTPDGQQIQVFPQDSEPVDQTESVLAGQPATNPDAESTAESAAPAEIAALPVLPLALVAVVVIVLAAVFLLRKKR